LRARVVDEARADRRPSGLLLAMKAAAWTMRSPRRFARAERLMRVGRVVARRGRIRALPWPGSAWTTSRDLPAPPKETFREWWLRERGHDESSNAAPPTSEPR
jgi:L-lactate dehydrogenase complex protein LldF